MVPSATRSRISELNSTPQLCRPATTSGARRKARARERITHSMAIGDLTLDEMRRGLTGLRPFLFAGGAALLLIATPAHHHAGAAAGPSRRRYTIPIPSGQSDTVPDGS